MGIPAAVTTCQVPDSGLWDTRRERRARSGRFGGICKKPGFALMAIHPEQPPFDGLLNFYKPGGITSAKALYRVRSLTRIRKSGHAGTLDPAAEGVLLLCMGRATKRVEALMNLPKVYCAHGRLDVTSRSLDSDSALQAVEVQRVPRLDEVERAAEALVGRIQQVPPVVSALKIKGVPAYKLAGRDRPVDLPARQVRVYRLTVQRFQWPEIEFEVVCGRGTYVRALIRDLGAALDAGGCLTALTRTAVGPFTAAGATRLEDLQAGLFEQHRIPLERLDALLDAQQSAHGGGG